MATDIEHFLREDRRISENLLHLQATRQLETVLANNCRLEDCVDPAGVSHQRKVFGPAGRMIYASNPDRVAVNGGRVTDTIYKQNFERADHLGTKAFAVPSESGALLDLPVETSVSKQSGFLSATFESSNERTVVERNTRTGELRLRVGVVGEHHEGVFALKADRHGNMQLRDGFMVTPETSDAQIRAYEKAEAFCTRSILSDLSPKFIETYVAGSLRPVSSSAARSDRQVQGALARTEPNHSNGFMFKPQAIMQPRL